MTDASAYIGARTNGSASSDYTAMSFFVRQFLATVANSAVVRVLSCTNSGGASAVGFVDVQPLVNQTDGAGTPTPHGTVHGLPYTRIQGGTNAVICDPAPGDIGLAVFADRDISAVKRTRAQANPTCRRKHSMADGIYIGGILNAAPTQYIAFTAAGINIVSPTKITMSAPTFEIDAPAIILNGQVTQTAGTAGSGSVTMQGPVTVTNDVTASGTSLHTHHHGGVQTGGGNTGAPV